MSEKENKFIQILTTVLGGFLLALVLGGFAFYQTTLVKIAVQDERIGNITEKSCDTEKKVETMRLEWREDIKEIKMNLDKVAESQNRLNFKQN